MGEEARELSHPDESSLIEEILWPYPTARLEQGILTSRTAIR